MPLDENGLLICFQRAQAVCFRPRGGGSGGQAAVCADEADAVCCEWLATEWAYGRARGGCFLAYRCAAVFAEDVAYMRIVSWLLTEANSV